MATDDGEAFAAQLRRHRLAAGLSQEALAERAGLSVRGLSDLERGARRVPHPSTVARLAEALGLDAAARTALTAAGRGDGAAGGRGGTSGSAPWGPRPGRGSAATDPGRGGNAEPSPDGLPTTPPIPLSGLVGRGPELAEIRRLLGAARLLTLTGAGGMGKTRLAIEAARTVTANGARPAAFVELAPLAEARSVPQAVATALGVPERPGRPLPDVLAEAIGARPVLLVLDNCEHVVLACAALADRLLQGCPGLRVLATSREPLGIGGEVLWRVPSLRLPDAGAPAGRVAEAEAVRLFVERAQAVQPGFALDEGNAAAVAEVCRRLDGIPLALELAAARVRALSVGQIADRLDDRFRLLVGGSRTALPRQRTLAATLDWSHQLLAPPEQALLRRLAVFAGGWTLEAAEAVGAGDPVASDAVLDLLTGLVDKSLVLAQAGPGGGEARYRLLETVRQYAADRLREAGEAAEARDRHLAWATGWAERTTPGLVGHDQAAWRRRMALEHDNVRAALEWGRARGDGEAELRLAAALGRFWHLHGPSSEGRAWLRHALAHSTTAPSPARALALNWAGRLATVNGEDDDRRLLEESAAMAREVGDQRLLALALRHLSMAAQRQGDEGAAAAALEAALATARQAGDRREEAFDLVSLGAAAVQSGDPARAAPLLAEGLAIGREVGDAGPVGWALSVLGAIAAGEGRREDAAALFREALDASRPVGYWAVTVAALAQLGALERDRGDLASARALGRECIVAAREVGDLGLVAAALASFGDLELRAGRDGRGVRLLGAESAWRATPGSRPARRFVSFWGWPAPDAGTARARMGEEAFTQAWAAGQRLTLEQAVAEALEDAGDEAQVRAPGPPAGFPAPVRCGLSPREQEVAGLIAGGLTNRQIAERLVITERTAANHVEHILQKLQLTSRVQVGVWAAAQGLGPAGPAGPPV